MMVIVGRLQKCVLTEFVYKIREKDGWEYVRPLVSYSSENEFSHAVRSLNEQFFR